MIIIKQLSIVFLIFASLPLVIRLLWKLRLLPLAVCYVVPQLFFPKWAADHPWVCLGLFVGSLLFFIGCWGYRLYDRQRENRFDELLLLEQAEPLYPAAPEE